jgi:putative polyhydroxyalkanoate system protein
MSHINIRRAHSLDRDKLRRLAEEMAVHLDNKFGLKYHWKEDTLYFERSGVSGHIQVEPSALQIQARLGFLLSPFKSRFEREIHDYMDRLFEQT